MTCTRRLAAHEARRLRAIRLRALATDPDAFCSTLQQEREFGDEIWRARLADPRVGIFVARLGDEDAGLATCQPATDPDEDPPGTYHLTGMWLDGRARGTGAADLLIEAAVAHARAEGADRLTLRVAEANGRAIRVYERHGFAPTGRTGTFPPPRDGPEFEMGLSLAADVQPSPTSRSAGGRSSSR